MLEVLLGMMIFSIVLLAINSVFFSALHLRNLTTDAVEKTVPIEQAVAVIKHDLANIVLPGTNALFGPFQTTSSQASTSTGGGLSSAAFQTSGMLGNGTSGMVAGRSSPIFYTATGVIDMTSPYADVQMVSYYLAPPKDNTVPGMDLYRSVSRNLLPVTVEEPASQFLMGGVEAIYFFFYDPNQAQWLDTWDSTTPDLTTGLTNVPPQAIKVQIQLASDQRGRSQNAPIEIVVPLLVQASTNQVTSTAGGG